MDVCTSRYPGIVHGTKQELEEPRANSRKRKLTMYFPTSCCQPFQLADNTLPQGTRENRDVSII